MRRRFNHNARVIQELYGRNFSLESLLNEDEAKTDDTADVKISDATKDTVISRIKNVFKSKNKSVSDNAIQQKGLINIIVSRGEITNKDTPDAIGEKIASIRDEDIEKAIAVGEEEAKTGGGSSGGSAKTGGATSKTDKIKEIQKIIGADSDGKWGPKTNAAWKTWVTSNKDKIIKYLQDTNKDETGDGIENLQAAELAGKGGHDKNLDGVYDFCIAIKGGNFDKNEPEKKDKNDGEEGSNEGSKKGDESWVNNRWEDKAQAKEVINTLHGKHKELYDAWPMMGRVDVAVGAALKAGKLHVGFVRSKTEFTEKKGESSFMNLIQTGGYSSIEDFIGFDDEALNIYSKSGGVIDTGDLGGDLYYDEYTKQLLLDSAGGDYIIKGIYLSDDKKYLKHDPERYDKEFDEEGNKINESWKSLGGRMLLGESRATLYRRRYHGRY